MRGAGLDGLLVLHHRLDGESHVRAGEALVRGFFTGDHRDGQVVAEKFLILGVDHLGLHDGLLPRLVGGVALLPEKFGGAEEQPRPHFPTHHVRPLIDQQRQIAVGLDPAGEGGTDDRLRGRPDHVGLGQLTGRDHFGFAGDGIFHHLQPVMRDHRALGSEALGVFRLLFQIGQRDEQREIGVLVARRFEAPVKLLLDELPDAISPWFDDHAAARFRVLRHVGGLDDLLVPLGEILGAGGADGGLFCEHDGCTDKNHGGEKRASKISRSDC